MEMMALTSVGSVLDQQARPVAAGNIFEARLERVIQPAEGLPPGPTPSIIGDER
jgi:hypothetical protein